MDFGDVFVAFFCSSGLIAEWQKGEIAHEFPPFSFNHPHHRLTAGPTARAGLDATGSDHSRPRGPLALRLNDGWRIQITTCRVIAFLFATNPSVVPSILRRFAPGAGRVHLSRPPRTIRTVVAILRNGRRTGGFSILYCFLMKRSPMLAGSAGGGGARLPRNLAEGQVSQCIPAPTDGPATSHGSGSP